MSDLKDNLMSQINNDELKMRSRNIFILLKALFEFGLIALVILVIFLLNLSFYLPKKTIMMHKFIPGEKKISLLFANIPWLYLILGVLGLTCVIWVLYKYQGLYKKGLMVAVAIVSGLILVIAYFLSISNINETFEKRREFKPIYERKFEEDIRIRFRGGKPPRIQMMPGTKLNDKYYHL